jgi:FAD/FMN-containing dehydrogenase
MTLPGDVAVPKPALPALIERSAALSQARELIIGTFGRAGRARAGGPDQAACDPHGILNPGKAIRRDQ